MHKAKKHFKLKRILTTNMVILLLFLPVMLMAVLLKIQENTPIIPNVSSLNYSSGWYDKNGKVIMGTECVRRNNKVFHKIVKPAIKQESWGEWIYNYKTGDKQVITNDDKILDAII